jgi:thiol-disulfide isomerase/thioredoxin
MPRAARALSPHVSPGFIVLFAAIVVALLGGAWWRLANGRMREPRGRAHQAAVSLAPADGSESHLGAAAEPNPAPGGPRVQLTSGQIGRVLGERATLLQFSSAFCAPCRATRRILAEVADMTPGVAHVEIDAESRLDLVRQLNVLRTPTVLVLDADGGIVRRASGQPRKPDVIAAIGAAVGLGLCCLPA